MSHRPSVRATAAVFALLAAALAACGGSSSSESSSASATASTIDDATATPTGTITVYSGRTEKLVKPVIDRFTAATGVTVELRAGDSGALAAQILTEGKASPADVFFSQDAGALGAVAGAGLLRTLPAKGLLDVVDPAYRATDGTWVGTSGRVRVLVVNPTLAPNPPKTIDDLLAPAWKGRLGYAPTNASWQSFVTALRVLRGEEGAKTWLTAFAAQQPKAYEKNGAVRDAVDKGEIAIGFVNHYYLYEKIAAEGAAKVVAKNVYLAPGDPGGLVNVAGAAVLASSDNAVAAQTFVRFLLNEESQSYFATTTFEYPLRTGVPQASDLPTLASLRPPKIDLADLESIEKTQELLTSVGLLTK